MSRLRPGLIDPNFMSKEPFKNPAESGYLRITAPRRGCRNEQPNRRMGRRRIEFLVPGTGRGSMVRQECPHWTKQIRARFLALHEQVVSTEGGGVTTARSMLAAVIVLDQLSRNLFRGTPRAFAADPLARRLARQAIAQGFRRCHDEPTKRLFPVPPLRAQRGPRGRQSLSVDLMRVSVARLDALCRGAQGDHRSIRAIPASQCCAGPAVDAGGKLASSRSPARLF